MAEEKKGGTNWIAVMLGGCGCFVFAIGVLVVIGYFAVMKATAAPETAIHEFLDAAGAGDVETAHGYFSGALKAVQPLDDFRAVVEQNPQLFNVTETKFTVRSRDLAKATFAGTVILEDGSEVTAEFVLIEEEGEWKLISYEIGSGG